MAKKYIEADEFWNRLISRSENNWVGFDTIDEVLSGMPDINYEIINDAHNEGYDVGYWAGRRDYEPKWIPVTERLPEEDKEVLISYRYKEGEGDTSHVNISITTYGTMYQGITKIKGWRPPFKYFHLNYEVIAWMPKPKPYKEGEKE